jgi:hypothetical protein
MRHLIGIILAAVMAGVLFFAGARGYLRLLRLPAPAALQELPTGGSLNSERGALAALIAVAVTGLLAGILIAAPRISPLAAGLPGLLLLSWTVLYLVSARHAVDLIPLKSHAYGAGFEALLSSGILGAAGLAIIPVFVPSRWRARARAAGPEGAEAGEFMFALAASPASQAPAEPIRNHSRSISYRRRARRQVPCLVTGLPARIRRRDREFAPARPAGERPLQQGCHKPRLAGLWSPAARAITFSDAAPPAPARRGIYWRPAVNGSRPGRAARALIIA